MRRMLGALAGIFLVATLVAPAEAKEQIPNAWLRVCGRQTCVNTQAPAVFVVFDKMVEANATLGGPATIHDMTAGPRYRLALSVPGQGRVWTGSFYPEKDVLTSGSTWLRLEGKDAGYLRDATHALAPFPGRAAPVAETSTAGGPTLLIWSALIASVVTALAAFALRARLNRPLPN